MFILNRPHSRREGCCDMEDMEVVHTWLLQGKISVHLHLFLLTRDILGLHRHIYMMIVCGLHVHQLVCLYINQSIQGNRNVYLVSLQKMKCFRFYTLRMACRCQRSRDQKHLFRIQFRTMDSIHLNQIYWTCQGLVVSKAY